VKDFVFFGDIVADMSRALPVRIVRVWCSNSVVIAWYPAKAVKGRSPMIISLVGYN